MNNTFCALPWTHICSTTTNDIIPCCRFFTRNPPSNVPSLNVDPNTALNTERFKQIREDMLSGKKVPECKKCYFEEENNKESYRQYANFLFLKEPISNFDKNYKKTYSIEISLDNICNLQCRMCSSQFSTKLILRDRHLNYEVFKKLESDYSFLEKIDISELTKIKILGGEPLMSPNFEKFLDFIIANSNPKNITIHLITNGTQVLKESLIEKLNLFDRIQLAISLDAYDIANDYQRYGSSYLSIWNNALEYNKTLSNSKLTFHTVVTLYNANVLHKTLSQFEKYNYGYSVDFVYNQEMAVEYSTDLYAEWLLDKNKSHSPSQKYIENMLKRRHFDEEKWSLFLSNTKKLDNYYKISLEDYNKELFNFLRKNYGY